MDDQRVEIALVRLGHVASWAQLRAVVPRPDIRRAVANGQIERVGWGRYATAHVTEGRRVAHRHTAVVSHLSAALAHGWKVHTKPTRTVVTVPRNRKVSSALRKECQVHWAPLSTDEVTDGLTVPLRTVVDCARTLPFTEALCVADQALRCGQVTSADLAAAATALRGKGAANLREVADAADGRSFNPLESTLRAIALRVPGLSLVPQFTIREPGFRVDVDLADPVLRLAIEAEGYEHHGTREGLRSDCRRATMYAVHGWTQVRYAYEHVMFEAAFVEDT